jgi:ribonucleoside-diphosphate reductase alpha chain
VTLKAESEILRHYILLPTASELAVKLEGPYSTFEGSPISQGEFQSYTPWNIKDEDLIQVVGTGAAQEKEVMEHGVRIFQILAAPMPHQAPSQILGKQ